MRQIVKTTETYLDYVDTLQKEIIRVNDQFEKDEIDEGLYKECLRDCYNKIKASMEERLKFL